MSLFITLTGKKLLGRKRPQFNTKLINKYKEFRGRENNCSLPSGDALQSITFLVNCYYVLTM